MIWSFKTEKKTGKIVADVKVISNFIKFARNANVPFGKILCSLLIFFSCKYTYYVFPNSFIEDC